MITINKLSKRYSSSSLSTSPSVFTNYHQTFSHKKECIFAKNGQGKSTLLLMISGLLDADSGDISVNNKVLNKQQRKETCAIASDGILLPPFLSAKEVLLLTQKVWACEWPSSLIRDFMFSEHIQKGVGELSAGNLKKLHLINALMRQTPILLLDEPNIALDKHSLIVFWETITQYKGMVLVASNESQRFAEHDFVIRPLLNQEYEHEN